MALSLYLDDCANSDRLADLLRQAGHTVVRPADAGIRGSDDRTHFDYACRQGLILITKNPKDFLDLHDLMSTHPGIFAVYQDNDVTKDMTYGEIVAAIAKLEAAVQHGYAIADQFHRLNDWR